MTPLLSDLQDRKPTRFFVYPIVVDAVGNEEIGMRLECLTFEDAVYVARRLVPEITTAVAVSAHELIPDEEGQEGEIVFAEVATVGTVSKDVLRATRPRRARNLATSRRYLAPSAYRRRAFGIRRFYRTHDDRGVVGRGSGEASLTRPAWLSDRRSLLRGDLTLFPLCSHNLPSAAGAVVELVAALMRESEKLTASVSRGFSRSDFLKWP